MKKKHSFAQNLCRKSVDIELDLVYIVRMEVCFISSYYHFLIIQNNKVLPEVFRLEIERERVSIDTNSERHFKPEKAIFLRGT